MYLRIALLAAALAVPGAALAQEDPVERALIEQGFQSPPIEHNAISTQQPQRQAADTDRVEQELVDQGFAPQPVHGAEIRVAEEPELTPLEEEVVASGFALPLEEPERQAQTG